MTNNIYFALLCQFRANKMHMFRIFILVEVNKYYNQLIETFMRCKCSKEEGTPKSSISCIILVGIRTNQDVVLCDAVFNGS